MKIPKHKEKWGSVSEKTVYLDLYLSNQTKYTLKDAKALFVNFTVLLETNKE